MPQLVGIASDASGRPYNPGVRTTAELREGFLSFFEEKGHKRLPSWPLIPRPGDHSTLLTTAGMQPQMPYFLGLEQPPALLTTLAQKCFRTPDIDEVGLDGHHLTFFEMLGNFSFGQYYKEGAIAYATEFLLDRMKVDWDRLWVTVHAGDPDLGLGPDETSIELWEKIGMPRDRIVGLPTAENFWWVGGPGPCGQDSEIYYDFGEEHGCGEPDCAPACPRCERFLEFWNLVFMEYELRSDGTLVPLPQQNVDTGLGLERTARVLQNVLSVYETDGYQTIMDWIEAESGVAWTANETATKAHRVLADHGRGMTALVADGVTPSNEGRGYVLRRIIRRALQHGYRIGVESPFLARLTDVVIEQMGDVYPEMREHQTQIHEVLTAEEDRFSETLARGMRLFEDVVAKGHITPDDAFELTATYGFPFELTKELARERGLEVNEEEFTRLMEEHREISRAGAGRGVARASEFARAAGFRTEFVGYEKTEALTQIGALEALEGTLFLCKLRESPFYAEGGGQVTDQGFIEHEGTGARAELREAYRFEDDQVLVFEGEGFAEGDRVRAVVNWHARFPTMANHTATHLLHAALRELLGDHVKQAGSAVRPDKLRFDFTHGQALTEDERARVERIVNEKVFANLPVRAYVTPIEEARRLGAMMLFGEKYGEDVRVIEIDEFSRELCGGTHCRWTAEIGPFVIVSESSVGAGVRRIEALTDGEAFSFLHEKAREAAELREQLERARKEKPKAKRTVEPDILVRDEISGAPILVAQVEAMKGSELRDLSDRLRQTEQAAIVLLGSIDDGRAYLVVNVDRSLVDRGVDAVALVREAAKSIEGGGGGRATLAEAGGKNPDGLSEAYEVGRKAIASALA